MYAKEYVFFSIINHECHIKSIKFEREPEKAKRAYVFKCFVVRLNNPFSTEVRYLANGFHENSVVVMKPSGKKMVLEAYVSPVSVFIENSTQNTNARATRVNCWKLLKKVPRFIYHSVSSIIDKLGK